MSMEINSVAAIMTPVPIDNAQQRQEYFSALSAALKSGNLGAAQEAIFGLKGAGGLSPASLFSKIEQAVKSENLDGAQKSLKELQDHRKGFDTQVKVEPQELSRGHFPGMGSLISTKA